MKVEEFEDEAWKTDKIRIVIRAEKRKNVGDFPRKQAVKQTTTVSEYLDKIKEHTNNFDVIVVDGSGEKPNGNSLIRTIRDSYNK